MQQCTTGLRFFDAYAVNEAWKRLLWFKARGREYYFAGIALVVVHFEFDSIIFWE